MSNDNIGMLASIWCKVELPLQVMKSQAGFYIGTADQDGPVSRESEEHFPTQQAADVALANGSWTQKSYP